MDNHHRNSIVEPNNGGYAGPDTRNQLNTTTTLPKPQQRGQEFVQRQPRPEFYHQGPYGAPNRPPGQPQRPPPPQQHQQQQQPRTSGDNKASPWNIIRQTLPPEVTVRGQIQPQQQRPPLSQQQQQQQHQQQFYNMQQRPPPSSQDQQQLPYRQQPAPSMQERRPTLSRIDDRPPFRSENNRPVGHRPSNAAEDDEEVVVNSSTNQQQQQQQQQPPPMIRRDSTVFAGNRAPPDLGDPNRQWQRPQGPGTMAAPSYGKPMMEQQYGRQSTVAAIPEVQEQQRYPQTANNYKQDDDGGRRSMMGVPQSQPQGPNPKAPPQLMRRDSVLDVVNSRRDSVMDTKNVKSIDPSSRRMEVVPDEYNRRSMQQDLQQEDSGSRRLPEMGGRKSQLPPDQQLREEVKRPAEYYKKTAEEQENSGSRRLSDYRNSRPPELIADYDTGTVTNKPLMSKEDKPPVRDYEQQQQSRYDRKVPLEKESVVQNVAVAEHGNRASELRKAHFEATHLKSTKDQQQQQQKHPKTQYNENRTYDVGREMKATTEDTVKSKDYAAALKSTPENELNKTNEDIVRNKDELLASQSKNLRPDTLNLIKDNEPLKDSSNSKGNYRSDNDVGKSPSKIPKKDRSEIKTPTRAITPKSPADGVMSVGQKKLPMNKIQVGSAPSPNLKVVRSKIGSLQNTSHKPGGGQVKIENRKLEWKAGTRVVAKNDTYVPGGGDKKIQSVKLQWNAKPKVGSLENKTHKPGGGDKKIETVKLDFKDKAKPKIGSKDNIKHTPGGGTVKSQSTQLLEMESPDIEDQKLEIIKAQSKVGSLDNVKHKPGGGEVKIFDDKNYIKQTTGQTIGTPTKSQLQRSSSMKSPTSMKFYDSNERPKSQVKIVVTPTSEDLFIKKETDTSNDGFRKSSNVRSPSLQNNIVIPEEAVRSKK